MSLPLKILLVQLYSNGDCLYATTVARQIKNDFPNCKLTWGIASYCKSIIANNNYVDEIMEVNTIAKNDIVAFRKFKKQLNQFKEQGIFDEIFITHNMDTNLALYDGSIRSGIFRAYPNPITVPVQPVLHLYDEEGNAMPPEELPLVKTLKECYPYHKTFWIESLKGKREKISVTSYPIIGRASKFLGAVAIFWASKDE